MDMEWRLKKEKLLEVSLKMIKDMEKEYCQSNFFIHSSIEGNKYEGNWVDDKFDGIIIITKPNGTIKRTIYKNGVRESK